MPKARRVYLGRLEQPELFGALNRLPHDPAGHPRMRALRKFADIERRISHTRTDFAAALAIASFTSGAWRHDGFNSSPEKQDALTLLHLAQKGASFSCVQFGSVFVQLCHAVGIPARVLQVQTKRPDLGTSGQGHVTAEFFDSQRGKWIWVDPQIHAYATRGSLPLSFSEFAELERAGRRPRIHFSLTTMRYLRGDRAGLKQLSAFVRRYVWSARVAGQKAFLTDQSALEITACRRKGVVPAVTFQGFADALPVDLPRELFDAPVNVCRIGIRTKAPSKLVKWSDVDDYRRRAHENYARGEVTLELSHNVPWFRRYVLVWNGRRRFVNGSRVQLRLREGRNFLELWAENRQGRAGMKSRASIHFDREYPAVRNYW